MWHGMPYRALAHDADMLDERYDARKRNPWNEVEWGSHYSRSMASYGVFTAACGFEYYGPKRYIAFSPRSRRRISRPRSSRAEGWGSFTQKRHRQVAGRDARSQVGRLAVRTLAFDLPAGAKASGVEAKLAGKTIPATFAQAGLRVTITLKTPATIEAGQALTIDIAH